MWPERPSREPASVTARPPTVSPWADRSSRTSSSSLPMPSSRSRPPSPYAGVPLKTVWAMRPPISPTQHRPTWSVCRTSSRIHTNITPVRGTVSPPMRRTPRSWAVSTGTSTTTTIWPFVTTIRTTPTGAPPTALRWTAAPVRPSTVRRSTACRMPTRCTPSTTRSTRPLST